MTRRRFRLTRVVTTMGLFGGLCLLAACQWPTQPTSACVEVSGAASASPGSVHVTADCRGNVLTNQPGPVAAGGGTGGDGGSGTGGTGGTGGESTGGDAGAGGGDASGDDDAPPGGSPAITAYGQNGDGAVIYQMGPGSAFTRTGGDAATAWCRPDSDCNGAGVSRTLTNVARPPDGWTRDRHAFFRRSGSDGTAVTFTVDGQPLTHTF